MKNQKNKNFRFFDKFSIFRPRHEMQLYSSYGHNFGAVGKLGISAFEWYQSCDLRININVLHEPFELLTSFTGSKIYNSRYFSFTGTLIYRIYECLNLYATYGHNPGTVGKLGTSASEWY